MATEHLHQLPNPAIGIGFRNIQKLNHRLWFGFLNYLQFWVLVQFFQDEKKKGSERSESDSSLRHDGETSVLQMAAESISRKHDGNKCVDPFPAITHEQDGPILKYLNSSSSFNPHSCTVTTQPNSMSKKRETKTSGMSCLVMCLTHLYSAAAEASARRPIFPTASSRFFIKRREESLRVLFLVVDG